VIKRRSARITRTARHATACTRANSPRARCRNLCERTERRFPCNFAGQRGPVWRERLPARARPHYRRRVPQKAPRKTRPNTKAVPPSKTKKRTTVRTTNAPLDEADPRFVPVARAFAKTPGFSLMESKSGALCGMTLNGKSFGMSSQGRFILKLDEARAAALVADGTGKPFSPSAGRTMKGWLEVTHPNADWVALAKEALRIAVSGAVGGKKSRR
jgi:hypothetical protein